MKNLKTKEDVLLYIEILIQIDFPNYKEDDLPIGIRARILKSLFRKNPELKNLF